MKQKFTVFFTEEARLHDPYVYSIRRGADQVYSAWGCDWKTGSHQASDIWLSNRQLENRYGVLYEQWEQAGSPVGLEPYFVSVLSSYVYPLSAKRILRYEDVRPDNLDRVDWRYLEVNVRLPEKFIMSYRDYLPWTDLCCYQTLSEELLEACLEYLSKNAWGQIACHQKLSEWFVREHKAELLPFLDDLIVCQDLSGRFINELTGKNVPKPMKWISCYQSEGDSPVIEVFDLEEEALADAVDASQDDDSLEEEERIRREHCLRTDGYCRWSDDVRMFIERVPYHPAVRENETLLIEKKAEVPV